MKLALAFCVALGGTLPLIALAWGWRATRREYRKLVADLDAIDTIIQAPPNTYANAQAQANAMNAIRVPAANNGRVIYTFEWMQRLILKQALSDLTGPAWLAFAGVVIGTVAGVWSMWL
jgi:hypothetical protein